MRDVCHNKCLRVPIKHYYRLYSSRPPTRNQNDVNKAAKNPIVAFSLNNLEHKELISYHARVSVALAIDSKSISILQTLIFTCVLSSLFLWLTHKNVLRRIAPNERSHPGIHNACPKSIPDVHYVSQKHSRHFFHVNQKHSRHPTVLPSAPPGPQGDLPHF